MIHRDKVKTVYPVLLADAKLQIGLCASFTTDDAFITVLIEDATQEAENYIDSDIALTANIHTITDFAHIYLEIQNFPLLSVSEIAYKDEAGDYVVIDSSTYTVTEGITKFAIEFDSYISTDALRITYTAGYTTGATCPNFIKQAIRKKVTDLYDVQRGSYISKAFHDSQGFEKSLEYFKRKSY